MGDAEHAPTLADVVLARRVEAAEAQMSLRCAEAHRRLYPDAGAGAQPVAGGYAVFTGPGSPFSRAIGLGLQGPVALADIEQLEAFYRERRCPALVQVCLLADDSLLRCLGHRGYRPIEFANVLVKPIAGGETLEPGRALATVRPVSSAEVDVWAETVAQGFFDREEVTPEQRAIGTMVFHVPDIICFLAWIGGIAAGAAAVAPTAGLALMSSASTRVAFRRHGIHTTLLKARLAAAATAGCDLAVVSALAGSTSQRNAERQGFHAVHTKMTMVKGWNE